MAWREKQSHQQGQGQQLSQDRVGTPHGTSENMPLPHHQAPTATGGTAPPTRTPRRDIPRQTQRQQGPWTEPTEGWMDEQRGTAGAPVQLQILKRPTASGAARETPSVTVSLPQTVRHDPAVSYDHPGFIT